MTDHDHDHDEEQRFPNPTNPRRLHGRYADGTTVELMADCIGSQIFESRTLIAVGEDETVMFMPLDNYKYLTLDPEA